MTKRMVLVAVAWLAIWAVPSQLAAQALKPESLLSADSVLFFRFDGMKSHQQAWDKTITAKLLNEEFGPLIKVIKESVLEALGPKTLSERLLRGAKPSELLTLQKSVRQLPKLLDYFHKEGFVFGLEVMKVSPPLPRAQATFILPNGSKPEYKAAIFGAARLLGLLNKKTVKQTVVSGRQTLSFQIDNEASLYCWSEGPHVVITLSSEKPQHTIDLAQGKRTPLTKAPLWSKLSEFKEYETYANGFLNVQEVIKVVRREIPIAESVIKALGINGLENVSFSLGMEDEYQRFTLRATAPSRKGLLQLVDTKGSVALKELPPLPPDTAGVALGQFDWSAGFDALTSSITNVAQIFGAGDTVREGLKQIDQQLGFSLKKDLLGSLDSKFAVYSAPSEGPLALGTTLAIRVKNRKKLADSLYRLGNTLAGAFGADVEIVKRQQNGADLFMVKVNERGFPFLPTIMISDDWACIALFPQSVQGFAARRQGKLKTWKTPDNAQAVLAKMQSKLGGARVTGLTISDPAPMARQLLAMAPIASQMIASFSGASFDVSLIPNAQMVTEPLKPNVTVVSDDGSTIRFDSYASFPMPMHMGGLELYFIGAFGFRVAN